MLKVSVVCSIVGLVVLYIISGRIEIEETTINKITMGQSDSDVIVKGKVSRIFEKDDLMVLELEKNEKISVVMFRKNFPDYIGIKEGDSVEVQGSVEDYNGKKEIIAERVRYVGG